MKKGRYIQIKDFLGRLIIGTEWEGHVFTVGGCVRDEIMGLEIKDIDMCVSLQGGGIHFAEWLRDNGYYRQGNNGLERHQTRISRQGMSGLPYENRFCEPSP